MGDLPLSGNSLRWTMMLPSGRRQATAHDDGARIITPSMTAWPPTVAPGERLTKDARLYLSDDLALFVLRSVSTPTLA